VVSGSVMYALGGSLLNNIQIKVVYRLMLVLPFFEKKRTTSRTLR
jgi:hypothetical protein